MQDIKSQISKIIEEINEKKKSVDNVEKLDILLERYNCALKELSSDGKITSNLLGLSRMYLESYSDYMNNSLLNDMDKLEKTLKNIRIDCKNAKEINAEIMKKVLNGIKTPHSTSQPVIYYENGKYYLAVFVFFYTREDIEAGAVERPTVWAIADIETGEIIEERQTKDMDFSDASYDIKYNVRSDAQYDTSKKYYDEAYAILDSVREKIISTGKLYKLEYKYYLDKILANIPKDYQRFYTDLSV